MSVARMMQQAAAGVSAGGGIVTDNLVFHLDAGNTSSYPGSGSTWSDISGSGLTGTISGATFSSGDGGHFYFNGGATRVTTNNQIDNDDFTYSAWFSPTTDTDTGRNDIMSTYEQTSAEWINLGTKSGTGFYNRANFTVDNNSSKKELDDTVSNPAGTWYMLTGTYTASNGAMDIYMNTTLNASGTTSAGTVLGLQTMTIGAMSSNSQSESFIGKISDVKAYTKVLSVAEITQNFDALRGRYGV